MREKTRRIGKYRWDSAGISKRRATVVALVTLLVVAGTSLGQWQMPEQEGLRQMEHVMLRRQQEEREKHELARQARRKVLEQLLEQLNAQTRETEEALEHRRAEKEEATHGLRSELEELREQTRHTETVLHEHEREFEKEAHVRHAELDALHEQMRIVQERLHEPPPAPPERAPLREMHERLGNLERQAEELRRGMGGREDADRPEAAELREALRRTHLEMREIQEQLERIERRETPREQERETPPARARRRPRASADELIHRCGELKAQIEEAEIDLWRLHDRRMIDAAETHELAQILRTLHRRTSDFEQQLRDQARAGQAEALQRRLREMHGRIEQIAEALEELRGGQQELRNEQQELRSRHEEELDEVRDRMNGLQQSTQKTNELLEELLSMDSPATVGSAGQHWRW